MFTEVAPSLIQTISRDGPVFVPFLEPRFWLDWRLLVEGHSDFIVIVLWLIFLFVNKLILSLNDKEYLIFLLTVSL